MTSAEASDNTSAGEWVEYKTPEGRPYYFNRTTKSTAWEKPDELKSAEERALSASGWREYVTDDGRKYWHHVATKQSTWTRPAELPASPVAPASPPAAPPKPLAASSASAGLGSSSGGGLGLSSSAAKPASISDAVTALFASRELPPAQRVFMELLEAHGVASSHSWEQAMRATLSDPRYQVLHTVGERKAAFADFVAAKKKKEADERSARLSAARKGFLALLHEASRRDLVSPRGSLRSQLPALEGLQDARLAALPEPDERELLFEQWALETERTARAAARELRHSAAKQFEQMLRDAPAADSQTWRRFRELYGDDTRFRACERADRLRLFEAHLLALERRDSDARRAEQARARRQSRIARDELRASLATLRADGRLQLTSTWEETARPYLASLPAFEFVLASPDYVGAPARVLFEDALDELEAAYRADKAKLKAAARAAQLDLDAPLPPLPALQAALPPELQKDVPALHWSHFHAQMALRVEERVTRAKRKRERAAERLLTDNALPPAVSSALHTAAAAPASGAPLRWDELTAQLTTIPPFSEVASQPDGIAALLAHLVSFLRNAAVRAERGERDSGRRREHHSGGKRRHADSPERASPPVSPKREKK